MQNTKRNQQSTIKNRRVRDFFYHLVVYLFLLALLFLTGGVSGAFVWIGLFWGFAVALHGIYAYFG